MTPCHCPHRCPECGRTFPITDLCHDHREDVHGVACGGVL